MTVGSCEEMMLERRQVSARQLTRRDIYNRGSINTFPQSITWLLKRKDNLSKYCTFTTESTAKMISDDDLYRLAIFLGSAAMLLIILYHFLEVNSVEEPSEKVEAAVKTDAKGAAHTPAR
ncbi:hypothetical protein LAWI1_G003134 [Lachnellula willkommii]|uniref:Dolichyl-diphosphooligosaccharide--protein glycosyltransferase subunit 4 n=1 Tax=Lachnellula willkommii TaxID=215461 RepID=A0A559MA40_9HELO|nr:hypothetical protein LAWI1_G003134 [Lachnellula willkommii]